MPSGREALDLADLGVHEHRRVAPDAADLAKHRQALVNLGAVVDLAGEQVDLTIEVVDQAQQAVEPLLRRLPPLERRQELAPALAEQIRVAGPGAPRGPQPPAPPTPRPPPPP